MPNVMIRRDETGALSFYIAKKDLEETVVSLEFDQADKFGGNVTLADGSTYYITPQVPAPSLPTTLRARRAE